MRSLDEYLFRAKQESSNLYLLFRQPQLRNEANSPLPLPDPIQVAKALQGSEFEAKTIGIAERLLRYQFPLLGAEIYTGNSIEWRRDYRHGQSSDLSYFRRIPYLNFEAVGDHKFVWELNRHQHLVLLAQAYRLTGDTRYLAEVSSQLESWFEQNPFQRGMNWTSALEVAFRALSWIWLYHLLRDDLPPRSRRKLLSGIYQHGLHLGSNLSIYFSPNTHLLGEAVALFTIAVCFPEFSEAASWREQTYKIVERQLDFQVRADGSHFEQSTYYHVYALDFFLWFYVLADCPQAFRPTLERMAEYLFWTLGPQRRIHCFGDDDGGRFFYPYGERQEFGRGTLAMCGALFGKSEWVGTSRDLSEAAVWWLGPKVLLERSSKPSTPVGSKVFADSGAVFLQTPASFLHFDAGPFGFGGAGHSHADSLSFCLTRDSVDVLIDPGTYEYLGPGNDRAWFRGTSAHNTLQIDEQDQGVASSPFRWSKKPEVTLTGWGQLAGGGWIDAVCSYAGYRHRRRLLLDKELIQIIDSVETSGNLPKLEQWWHWGPGQEGALAVSSSSPAHIEDSRCSPAYGSALPSKATVAASPESTAEITTVLHPGSQSVNVADAVRRFDRAKE